MLLKYPLRIVRRLITKYDFPGFKPYEGYIHFKDEHANNLVRQELISNKSLMICKFGTIEFATIRNYLSMKEPKKLSDVWKYIKREKKFLWWWENNYQMANNAGFFPATDKMMDKFVELLFNDIKEIDILCSYIVHENLINEQLAHVKKINTEGFMTPFRYENPWTELLEGKKVLVVHPFEESIQNQYKKRHLLFQNKKVLPDFELITIKAVQTIAQNSSTQFKDWFEALNYMKERINKTEFDIALIGCGAYGLPLAAHVKRMGKKGLHLASYVQTLFGIYGKRWADMEEYSSLINEHWVRPLPSEIPQNYKKVEGGAYW